MHDSKNIIQKNELQDTIKNILIEIEGKGLACAIRRNPEGIGIPLKGDVDVLIAGKNIIEIVDTLNNHTELLRLKISYGGLKAWFKTTSGYIKEIDFIWRVAKCGVIVMDQKEIRRILNSYTILLNGVPVLQDEGIGLMVFAEKNNIGDFQRYERHLASIGLAYEEKRQRKLRLIKLAVANPFQYVASLFRWITVLFLRFFYPSGISVRSKKEKDASRSRLLKYLFDKRIIRNASWIKRFYYRNFRGGLVFVKKRNADVVVNEDVSVEMIEQIVTHVTKETRTAIPTLLNLFS